MGDVRVHHDLPGVDGEIGVVEAPVERFRRNGLVGRVVIRRKVLVRKRLGRVDSFPGVEDEHLLEQVQRERVCAPELLRERDALALGERLHESKRLRGELAPDICDAIEHAHILAANGLDHILRGRAQQLRDDRELVDVWIGSAGQSPRRTHDPCPGRAVVPQASPQRCNPRSRCPLRRVSSVGNAGGRRTSNVVLLPGEHDLGGAIVARGDVARHLGVRETGEAKVANLEIAVLVDEDVGRLEVTVHHAGGMNVFETTLRGELGWSGRERTRIW